MTLKRTALLSLCVLLLAGCNRYDLFRVGGFKQESFSNKVDLLFVLDNSTSMTDESIALANNFDDFISSLADQQELPSDGVTDATANYIQSVRERGSVLNYQVALTTTDIPNDFGALKTELLARGDNKIEQRFIDDLLCNATCFCDENTPGCLCGPKDEPGTCDVPYDATFTCTNNPEFPGSVSQQYLDCVCGETKWQNANCGSGAEEGLEAVLMAMCRSHPNPPSVCFDKSHSQLDKSDIGSNNEGDRELLRESSLLVPIILSDEGDVSRRLVNGQVSIDTYTEIFDQFRQRMAFVVVGPDNDWDQDGLGYFDETYVYGTSTTSRDSDGGGEYDGTEVENGRDPTGGGDDDASANPGSKPPRLPCSEVPDGAAWSVVRYETMTEVTRGRYIPITEAAPGCGPRRFTEILDQLGEMLANLADAFPLQSIPQTDTITVIVDDVEVTEAGSTTDDLTGQSVFTDGWSYRSTDNAIVFHGTAVPEFNAKVEIYYLPQEGKPRDLPF